MKYQLSTLQTPEGRRNMEKQLKGKLWTMTLGFITKAYAMLLCKDFEELVHCDYKELGISKMPNGSKWLVEVTVSYCFSHGNYRYSVLRAIPVAAEATAPKPAPVSQPKPQPAPKPAPVSQPKPQLTPKSAPQPISYGMCSEKEAMRHAIMNLEPSPSWTVLIDETGDRFINDDIPNEGSRLGKTVALLLPQGIRLPQLPMGWHAKNDHERLSEVIHDLLDSSCGIVGLTVNELPRMNTNLWSGSIRTLMDLIVRLLPISGKTNVSFLVEEHSEYTPENGSTIMRGLCDDIHLRLGRVNPKRANNLSLTAKVISKTDSPYNGYVDAIANCWGSPNRNSRKLVKSLSGICLYMDTAGQGFGDLINKIVNDQSFDAQEWTETLRQFMSCQDNLLARHYLDDFAQRISYQPETWKNYLEATRQHLESKTTDSSLLARQLAWLKAAKPADTALSEELRRSWQALQLVEVNRREARSSDEDFRELVGLLFRSGHLLPQEWTRLLALCVRWQGVPAVTQRLDELAESTAAQPPLWESYLEETRQHLESKDIDQRLLGQQIAWLKTAMPADTELTDDLQLLWMTAELAEANHLGKVISDPELKSMFSYLTEHLMDEEPRLVAWATLNLSVAYTNAFDFESAEAIMDIWDRKPMQVLGHQYTGQIQSTLGQLAAFRGDNEEAVPLFDQAISNFAKMSNKLKSRQDIEQTTTYKLIAMLDLGLANTPDFDRVAEHFFNMPLEQAALFVPQDPAQRYKHHVLLRMLVSGDYPQAREAYLSQRQNWLTGAYHPWELIEFYRALLLDGDLDAQLRHLDAAFDIAKAGDATLQVIAAVILGSRLALADGRLDDYQALLDTIADELPDLGERLDVLRAQPQAKLPPLTLAARVLPFNFK